MYNVQETRIIIKIVIKIYDNKMYKSDKTISLGIALLNLLKNSRMILKCSSHVSL